MINLEELQTALGEALTEGDAPRIAKARKAVAEARQAAEDAEAIAEVQQQRAEVEKAARVAADLAERRKCMAELCIERAATTERVAELIKKFSAEVETLRDLHKKILLNVPSLVDADRSAMSRFDDRVRGECWRHHGLERSPWSDWEISQMPTLTEQVNAGNEYLISL